MPPIPLEIIEQVAAANDIVEIIGGYFPLKRMGGTFKALCPFHNERTPSFNVNPHRQIFKCFGCGAGGSVFRFVMDYEHVDFPTAVRKLAESAVNFCSFSISSVKPMRLSASGFAGT